MQQGDVLLQQTEDGGEITFAQGLVEMIGGLETSVYLSLFGGNEDDDGRVGNPQTWWGNIQETDPDFRYISETQYLTKALPPSSANLRRIEDAATRDLQWLINKRVASSIIVASSVVVRVTIPRLNIMQIQVTIEANGIESNFEFVENWKSL